MLAKENGAINEAIDGQVKIIEICLAQLARNADTESNKIIIRYAVGNILNALLNDQNGEPERVCRKPSKRWMSSAFYEEWISHGEFVELGKIGIYEHRVPMKVVIENLRGKTGSEILDYIQNNVSCVWVTKEEDRRLVTAGLSRKMPPSGGRYALESVGITIREMPVAYGRKAWRKAKAEIM